MSSENTSAAPKEISWEREIANDRSYRAILDGVPTAFIAQRRPDVPLEEQWALINTQANENEVLAFAISRPVLERECAPTLRGDVIVSESSEVLAADEVHAGTPSAIETEVDAVEAESSLKPSLV